MIPLLPHLLLAGGALLIFLWGALTAGHHSSRLPFAVALAATAGAGAAAFFSGAGSGSFEGMLDTGGYGRYFTLLIAAITLLTLLFTWQYARRRRLAGDELYGLILMAALGMALTAGSTHWLVLFLGLELLSLSFYVLIALRREDARSAEAGLKYFVMGAVSGAFLAFGIAMIYAATGTLDIAASLVSSPGTGDGAGVLLGLGLVLVGIGFKLSLVPVHLWTPDVYQGAPAPVTAFLAAGSKTALFAALLRVALGAGALWGNLVPVLWVLAALTMLTGNLTALAQTSVKRLLAYSSVAHMGYLLMALLAVRDGGGRAVMFYLAVYAVADLGAFGALGALSEPEGDRDDLARFGGAGWSHPWRGGLLAVSLLALAGLPPTGGFTGKFILFAAAIGGGYLRLAVLGILTAVVSIYYYLKVIVVLYLGPGEEAVTAPAPGLVLRLAGLAVVILILYLGLAPTIFLEAARRALESISVTV